MTRHWWSLAIFATSIASATFALYTLKTSRVAHAAAARTVAQNAEIPQPAEWVPFAADVVLTHGGESPPVYGHFYRDSHGCTRLETGDGTGPIVISIINVPQVRYFWWNQRRGGRWNAGPMSLPATGWKPIARRENIVGLQRHSTSIEVRRGRQYDLRADSGLVAYRYTNASGTLLLQVPDLNFFDVLKQTLEGRREAYSNIHISDQPEELFQPPTDAPIINTSTPGGIVAEPVERALEHLEHMRRGRHPYDAPAAK